MAKKPFRIFEDVPLRWRLYFAAGLVFVIVWYVLIAVGLYYVLTWWLEGPG